MNILNRTRVMIIIGLSLLLTNGCAKSDTPQDRVQEDPQVISQQNDQNVAPKPAVTDESSTGEEFEADKISGWEKLQVKSSLSELTEHGSQTINTDEKKGFSIYIPGSWTMTSSVLHDADNKKVGEIPPVILLKPGQEPVFLDFEPDIDYGEELISKKEMEINSCQGTKTVTKIQTESGSWYPHIYRLIDETYGFTIFLYSEEINEEDEALFDRIVNTFDVGQ